MGVFGKIFKNKNKVSHFLALDIGTEFVKALVVKMDQELGKGVVLGVGQSRQHIGNMHSGAVSNIQGVIESCEDAIAQAEEMAGVENIEKAIMGIAGEFVKGVTTTVHYERAKPEVRIDIPELRNIIQKVQWKAFNSIRRQLAMESGCNEIEVKLINAAITSVKIDGYLMDSPIGFQGRDVSIGIFNAYAPMVHLGALKSIADALDLELISISVEPYAVIHSLGIESDSKFGAIFVDIGGGTTDVALMRNGVLEGTVMFALGGRAFTKRIAENYKLSFLKAEEMKVLYSQQRLGKKLSTELDELFRNDCHIWFSGLCVALENLINSRLDILPSKILLCGGGSGLPGIYEILNNNQTMERANLPFARKPSVGFIHPRDVIKVVDKTGELNSPQDITPMGLGGLIVDLMSEKDDLSDMLNKAVKMVQN
jgi:cell division protein FtsA